jgi:hypothetical protein
VQNFEVSQANITLVFLIQNVVLLFEGYLNDLDEALPCLHWDGFHHLNQTAYVGNYLHLALDVRVVLVLANDRV